MKGCFLITKDNDWEANHKYTFENIANCMGQRSNPLQSVGSQLKIDSQKLFYYSQKQCRRRILKETMGLETMIVTRIIRISEDYYLVV